MTDSGVTDLILRSAALEVINAVKGVAWSQSGKVLCSKMYSQIKDLPAVDAVPVVRCKDCRHRGSNAICVKLWVGTKDSFFCAFGERRDSE